jgi:dienelactone hydrolase
MPARCVAVGLVLLLIAAPLLAAEPPSDTSRGDRMLEAYFHREARRLADACLADVKTKDDWERKRPELRRQLLEMLGLWPTPPRTDLKPVVVGKVEADAYTVEKLHFQSSPGLYVTANLYVPKKAKLPAPAVLYVCGHAGTTLDGVAYGSKVNYQHHPAWFAEHGYVCLIIDTLQYSEIPGIHHGTHHLGHWWWQTVGYTPAGVECWNGIRALDYLQTRKEVDPKRIGITGRSGGGAYSWWVAAVDERVQCAVPVAGIADLQAHVAGELPVPPDTLPRYRHGVITGHCDCMYTVNTYRWDFPLVAALIAPRPLMLGNSDADSIFPVPGYRRLADKVRRVYELYGAADKFVVLETAGPHKDTPELRLGAYRWMNRWLAHDDGEITERDPARLTPAQLKVFDRPPDDAINPVIQETFCKPAVLELPDAPEVAREWWNGKAPELMQGLREKVFRGWPENPPALDARPAADVASDGLRLRAFDFVSEENVELRLWLLTAAKVEKPSLVVLTAVDEPGWQEWTQELGPAFADVLQLSQEPRFDAAKFRQTRRMLEVNGWAFATVAPRGIGPTRWAEAGTPDDAHVRRRFVLLGQTLDGQRVWDVRRGLDVLRGVPELKGAPLWLQGTGDMAGVVLYAALFEPDVARLDLWHPPATHRQGPIFLNVRRVLDMPQAMALAFPRSVVVYVKDDAEAKTWEWPLQLQKALGKEHLKIRKIPG